MRWTALQADALAAQPLRKRRRCACRLCASDPLESPAWLSTHASPNQPAVQPDEAARAPERKAAGEFVYEGPLSKAVRRLKVSRHNEMTILLRA